jgi:hypothetical protein
MARQETLTDLFDDPDPAPSIEPHSSADLCVTWGSFPIKADTGTGHT